MPQGMFVRYASELVLALGLESTPTVIASRLDEVFNEVGGHRAACGRAPVECRIDQANFLLLFHFDCRSHFDAIKVGMVNLEMQHRISCVPDVGGKVG